MAAPTTTHTDNKCLHCGGRGWEVDPNEVPGPGKECPKCFGSGVCQEHKHRPPRDRGWWEK